MGGEFQVNTTTALDQQWSNMSALPDGGFVSVWYSADQDGDGLGVYGQRYGSDGAAVGGEFQVATSVAGDQKEPSAASTPDGGFVVTWWSATSGGTVLDLYGQRFGLDGAKLGGEFQVNATAGGFAHEQAVVSLEGGELAVAWTASGVGGEDIATRVYRLDDLLTGSDAPEVIVGRVGDDVILGQGGDDTLSGGQGDDVLIGGDGSDTYLFGRGEGYDSLQNTGSDPSTTDKLTFDSDIAKEQLWFTQSGDDLNIKIVGSGDQVSIADWYTNSSKRLDEISTGADEVVTEANVQQLVDAMAAFAPPTGSDPNLLQSILDDSNYQYALTVWTGGS